MADCVGVYVCDGVASQARDFKTAQGIFEIITDAKQRI